MTMTKAEWLAKTMLDRQPLTQAQVSALRPVFAPVFAQMAAAPAADMAGAALTEPTTTEPERTRSE